MMQTLRACAPHTVEVRTGPGSISIYCTTCRNWVSVLFIPTDEPERVIATLEDQARQQLGQITGYDRARAQHLLAGRYASAILEATGQFAPPEEDLWSWVSHVGVQLWKWDDSYRDPA